MIRTRSTIARMIAAVARIVATPMTTCPTRCTAGLVMVATIWPRSTARPVTSEILDRQPPFNLDAEMGVLGSIILSPDACDDIALILRHDDFYDDANRKLFEHMLAMHDDGRLAVRVLERARDLAREVHDQPGGDLLGARLVPLDQ